MTVVELGENKITKNLWKHYPENDGWEGYSFICPKCYFELIMNEDIQPSYNFCPNCGKKLIHIIDAAKEKERAEKKRQYAREYQKERRKNGN